MYDKLATKAQRAKLTRLLRAATDTERKLVNPDDPRMTARRADALIERFGGRA